MTDNPDLAEAIKLLRTVRRISPKLNWIGIIDAPTWSEKVDALIARHPEKPKLLPCPFCGGEAEVVGPRASREFFVICHQCEGMTQDAVSAADAIAAWNRRSGPVSGGKPE